MIRRLMLALGVSALVALAVSSVNPLVARQRAQPGGATPSASRGESATLLSDGRWLFVGGTGSESTAMVWDPETSVSTVTAGRPQVPRSFHSATVLADGTVLILGGRNGTALVDVPEFFDPGTGTFTPVTIVGAVPRASHTATLVSDGRVLVAGGSNGVPGGPPTEIWDLNTHSASVVGDSIDRSGHSATLMPDGRVLLVGGSTPDGQRAGGAVIVDSESRSIQNTDFVPDLPTVPMVTASMPSQGATDVDLDAHITLRFSSELYVAAANADTIKLAGPEGTVAARVIAAEGGRLVFVWPASPFSDASSYALSIAGVTDRLGNPVPRASIRFTTRTRRVDTRDSIETEEWLPTPTTSGRGWRTNRPPSPWESLPALEAPAGVSAVSGRVLRLDGRPLADVTLELEGHTTRTDRTGRFLLRADELQTGEHTLEIDARTANTPQRTYGFYEARIGAYAGKTTILPFTIWSPVIDTGHAVTIPSPTTVETVITTPTMPGLELHLPAGTVITDEDKHVVRTLSLTPIPLDRTPFPMPEDATFTMFFTIQPGGAYLSTPGPVKGGWLVYPNAGQSPVGKRVQFFNYDPDDKGWYPYGMGTVTAKGVVPDAKTRVYGFTGASFNDGATPPPGGGSPPGKRKGDPVDPSTGAFLMTKTDLSLPDVMPVTLTRTYNSQDSYARAFGIGMTHTYGVMAHSESFPAEADLYLPDGAKFHYARLSDPSLPWYATVFEHTASATGFYKSRMTFWGGIIANGGWQVTRKDGTVYVFGHAAPLQAIRDRYGNETRLTWSTTNTLGSGTGNLLRVTSPNGRWIGFTYDANNRVTQANDNLGRTVGYTYDASGRLSTVTDPENNVTTYTWDTSNRIVSVKDGRNIVYLTNEYTNGRVTKQTLADSSNTYAYAYTTDQSGNVTQTDVTDPRGHTERLTFDANHNVITDIDALNATEQRTTTIERNTGGTFPTAVIDGLNRRTDYTYDDAGHVLTKKRLAGTADAVTTTFTYEPRFFQLASIKDALNHTWTVNYDTAGHVTSIVDPLSHQTTVAMNTAGQVTSITDALNHQWQFGYVGGDLLSTTNPLGQTTIRFVDGAGRTLTSTDALGRLTQTTLDKMDRITTVRDPIGGQTSFSYDPNGRVLSLTDSLNHVIVYSYDTSDRIATRTDPLTHAETYTYDGSNHLTQLTDRKSQVTSYSYDALDRMSQVTYADNATVAYTFDAGDRITQIADSANGNITRSFDGLDRLTQETTPQGTVSYTYDADGRRASMTVAGQTTVTYGSDDAHRLTSITQGGATIALTYDNTGRRTALTYPNGIVATYGYDNANQLNSLTYSLEQSTLGDLAYTYDAAGNRTSVGGAWARTALPTAMTSASYDAANRVTTWGGASFSYDLNGNLTSDGTTAYNWNARDQLSTLTGSINASFAYDGVGRRRGKTVTGTSTNFLYDGLNLVQELTSSGNPSANLLTGPGIDETFTRSFSGGTETLLVDALGSTLELTDATGTVQTHYTFEPFGATATSGTTSTNSVQFTGRENDGGGTYFYRMRFYNSQTARFISEDSGPMLGRWTVSNRYAYVIDNPINLVDPSGAQACNKPNCKDVFIECLADFLVPGLSTVAQELLESGSLTAAIMQFNVALQHAATRGLRYPFKSSIFRGYMGTQTTLLWLRQLAGPLIMDYGIGKCLAAEYSAYQSGDCVP